MKPQSRTGHSAHDVRDDSRFAQLVAGFGRVRAQSQELAQPLSAEDCALQSMPEASPVKWHLAHTTWFFETFVLERALADYRPFHPQFRSLFNSYYVGVGPRHPRPERGLLSRPTLEQVHGYRRHIDGQVIALLQQRSVEPELLRLIELGIHHEQQHQELMLTDVKHLLSRNPLRPAYMKASPLACTMQAAAPVSWLDIRDGIRQIGHSGEDFCFDNEEPRHRVFIDACAVAPRLVTNGQYADFIAAGGYDTPSLWLSEGWDVKTAQGWNAPLYWERDGAGWHAFTLNGMQPLDVDAPVSHVSFFEADAYARWAQGRLPTEAEWETVASDRPPTGNFLEHGYLRPVPAGLALSDGGMQLYGDAWEWTRSSYAPYPGYRPAPGAVGEYNGKFMANQYVLRGGSCATPASHMRASYRNFFPACARWQFTGIRLARDCN